jgi:hypothetical protein
LLPTLPTPTIPIDLSCSEKSNLTARFKSAAIAYSATE